MQCFRPDSLLPSPSGTTPSGTSELPSRRGFLALPFAAMFPLLSSAAVVANVEPQKRQYIDPATEFEVTRWTEESATAALPEDLERALTRNDKQLLYASNRGGLWQPYLMNLPQGDSVQVAQTVELRPQSLLFLKDEKDVVFLDGPSLVRAQLRGRRVRQLYTAQDGWQPTGSLRIFPDDHAVAITEARDQATRVMLVELASGRARQLIESSRGALQVADVHPRYGFLILDAAGVPSFHGGGQKRGMAAFPEGQILHARFDAKGTMLMYLLRTSIPATDDRPAGERTQLMEFDLESNEHRLVANTSRFATFSPNADSSVFVGASGSVAQPLLMLLLRVTRREFSLMEHSASQPAVVRPFFSNDSQTVFFQSDRLGTNCIFSVSVKGLVERT
jgi:oligogalacturonide lyase